MMISSSAINVAYTAPFRRKVVKPAGAGGKD
jgi:hypothetical protein